MNNHCSIVVNAGRQLPRGPMGPNSGTRSLTQLAGGQLQLDLMAFHCFSPSTPYKSITVKEDGRV